MEWMQLTEVEGRVHCEIPQQPIVQNPHPTGLGWALQPTRCTESSINQEAPQNSDSRFCLGSLRESAVYPHIPNSISLQKSVIYVTFH
jgi:hypothetical protein